MNGVMPAPQWSNFAGFCSSECRKAAISIFTKLDRDHGTLDVSELRGRLSANELMAANPDHDGTLTLNEYLAVVGAALQCR